MNNLRQILGRLAAVVHQAPFRSLKQPANICWRFLIRTSAFVNKEIFEIMRQPLLILTLVLGPFLILLFFGIGYRNEPQALRTLFVVEQEDSQFAQTIEQNAGTLGKQLVFSGITSDLESARERLRERQIDLITVVPSDAYETIRNNQQALFQLYHHEIDPFQIDYINVFARVYVDAVNRRVLHFVTSEGQSGISQARGKLQTARTTAVALQDLLKRCADTLGQIGAQEQCDARNVRQYLQELDNSIDELELVADDSLMLLDAIEQELNVQTGSNTRSTLENIVRNTNTLLEQDLDNPELDTLEARTNHYITQLETLAQLENDLLRLEQRLMEFLDIDPGILISPFNSVTQSIATIETKITGFFAPAVIVLLLQHLTITFAALSIVKERQVGSIELFHVSPISAVETLLGKYLSYLLLGGVLATILLALVVFGLGVPILGSWFSAALVIFALLFSSLGIGFIISLVSKTDIQAVQYSMIVLLTSVFFSGFLLGLETLWEPVRVISWVLPATYGISLLRDIMLRGDPLASASLLQLAAFGLALFGVAWGLLRRSMASI